MKNVELTLSERYQSQHETRNQTLRLRCFERSFAVFEPDGKESWIDLAARRQLRIDRAAGTYTDESLFADLWFRDAELPNRLYVRDVMRAGGAAPADMRQFHAVRFEHELSVVRPDCPVEVVVAEAPKQGWLARMFSSPRAGADERIRVETSADELRFVYDSDVFLRCSTAGIGDAFAAVRFVHYLRWRVAGHPRILEWMARRDDVPLHTEIRVEGMGGFGSYLEVCAHRVLDEAEPTAPDLGGLCRVLAPNDDETMDAVLRGEGVVHDGEAPADLWVPAPNDPEAAQARLERATEGLETDQAWLSLLAIFEVTFESAVVRSPRIGEALSRCEDPRVKDLLRAITANDEESARWACGVFARLRPEAGALEHVVCALEAGIRSGFPDDTQAKPLLRRAVAGNPRMAGAWKDLGMASLGFFTNHAAWRCWDIARALCPNHPQLEDVYERELALERAHPEYFATEIDRGS